MIATTVAPALKAALAAVIVRALTVMSAARVQSAALAIVHAVKTAALVVVTVPASTMGSAPRREGGFGGDRPRSNERSDRGPRPERSFGDRPRREDGGFGGGDRPRFNDRNDRGPRPEGGDRPRFNKDRGPRDERKQGDRPRFNKGGVIVPTRYAKSALTTPTA